MYFAVRTTSLFVHNWNLDDFGPVLQYLYIGLDKSGYQVNIFYISPQKHMLWVLIRSTSHGEIRKISGKALLMSTHNICLRGEIRKISILLY